MPPGLVYALVTKPPHPKSFELNDSCEKMARDFSVNGIWLYNCNISQQKQLYKPSNSKCRTIHFLPYNGFSEFLLVLRPMFVQTVPLHPHLHETDVLTMDFVSVNFQLT